jgi:hypothetical protein
MSMTIVATAAVLKALSTRGLTTVKLIKPMFVFVAGHPEENDTVDASKSLMACGTVLQFNVSGLGVI